MKLPRNESLKETKTTTTTNLLWSHFDSKDAELPEIAEKTFDAVGGVDVCCKLALMCSRFQQYLTSDWHAESLKRLQTVYRFSNLQHPELCSVLQEIVTVSAVTVCLYVLKRFDNDFKVKKNRKRQT